MNTGQMIITIGAMMLVTILVLRISSTQMIAQESMQSSKFGILAISIANSVVEQATNKSFDEYSVKDYLTSTSQLSTFLGPGPGEDSLEAFKDFDDFNGYTKVYPKLPDSPPLRLTCVVNYVNPDASGNKVEITGSRTWHKMLTVTISSADSTKMDALTFRKVFSYFKFI